MQKIMMVCLLPLAIGLGTPHAMAQEPDAQRFSLERTDNGVIRLDRQTGAMALCAERGGTLTCRMAADERAAYDDELSRLEKRVAALEKQVAGGLPAGPQSGALPSDTEIDRSIGIMERFMRAFFGLVQEFQAEEQKTTPDQTLTP